MAVSFPDEKASAYIQSSCLQEDLSILIEPVVPFFCQYDVFVWAHEFMAFSVNMSQFLASE
jgi:hypothetical protein